MHIQVYACIISLDIWIPVKWHGPYTLQMNEMNEMNVIKLWNIVSANG